MNKFICVDIPGSKSISNRALILAALSNKKVTLNNFLFSDDTLFMIDALRKLGNKIEVDRETSTVTISGNKSRNFGKQELYIGNAGTAMRFLGCYIATGKGEIVLNGNKRMQERPIKDLVDALSSMGIKIEYLQNEGYPPIKIYAEGIKDYSAQLDCSRSSQYLSSFLLSAPSFNNEFNVEILGNIVSKPYIEMSLKMVKQVGGKIEKTPNGFKTFPSTYNFDSYTIEGDMSSASYFLAMALIGNMRIRINNFFKHSLQGDRAMLNILQEIGLKIIVEEEKYIVVEGIEKYPGFNLNLNDTPDIAQTLAAVALFATSPSEIRDVENMRIKETDRIKALNNEITKLGGEFIEFSDGFKIIPKPTEEYHGCEIETYDDHRMAMSLALTSIRIPGIKILNPECVSKTFPDFFTQFKKGGFQC
jgi:3-phosphoshikimate 1-carboxyvinyltransferase